MKKCFIGMSINKQLYFGILGTSFLFGFLCLLLVLLSSLKLFFHFNDNIKFVYNLFKMFIKKSILYTKII